MGAFKMSLLVIPNLPSLSTKLFVTYRWFVFVQTARDELLNFRRVGLKERMVAKFVEWSAICNSDVRSCAFH